MVNAPVRKSPPALAWLAIGLAAVLLAEVWVGEPDIVALDYSDFKILLGQGQIAQVRISARSIAGTATVPTDRSQLPEPVKEHLERASDETSVQFTARRVEDPALYQDLMAANIDVSGADYSNGLRPLLVWLTPALILAVAGLFVMRGRDGRYS